MANDEFFDIFISKKYLEYLAELKKQGKTLRITLEDLHQFEVEIEEEPEFHRDHPLRQGGPFGGCNIHVGCVDLFVNCDCH